MLAAEFGCVVAGIDLVADYCRAAGNDCRRAGLSRIRLLSWGDMAALPYDDDVFDAVFTLHTMMNIADKETLADNILRVLKPGVVFALLLRSARERCPAHISRFHGPGAKLSFASPGSAS
ncbi:MAG: class I SAM-dependent methyltransferase [Desulfobacterales bacterium]